MDLTAQTKNCGFFKVQSKVLDMSSRFVSILLLLSPILLIPACYFFPDYTPPFQSKTALPTLQSCFIIVLRFYLSF